MLQTFSKKSSKIDYQWNITITYFARLHRILSAKLYTNPLKFHPSRRLVPLHGCNLALLDEFSLFLRPIHNTLSSGFVLLFFASLFPWSAGTLCNCKSFFHQIEKQEEILKCKKENVIILDIWCNRASVICNKHPLSRPFLDRRVILGDWISHIIQYLRMQ